MSRLAPETLMLIKFLQDCHLKREVATIQAMNKLFSVTNREYYKSYLKSAKQELERQNMFFEPRWGKIDGTRCIVAYEPIKKSQLIQVVGQRHFDLVQRSTNRTTEIVARALPDVDIAAMEEPEQVAVVSTLYRLKEHKQITSVEHVHKIDEEIKRNHATGKIGEDHHQLMKKLFAGFDLDL